MPFPRSCCVSSLQHGVLPTQNVPAPGDPPNVTGPASTFSAFQTRARVYTRVHVYTQPFQHARTHIRACSHVYTNTYNCTQNYSQVSLEAMNEPMLNTLSHFFL